VSNADVRAVCERDENRCGYLGPSGHRCTEVAGLEVHHVEARAHGGDDTLANLGLRCQRHHKLEAERQFGADFISEAVSRERARRQRRRSTSEQIHEPPRSRG